MSPPDHVALLGQHMSVVAVRDFIVRAGPRREPVLIQGETGTGKEVVAQQLHAASGRRQPLVALNMTAVPEALAEAELFGVRKGAYTGATEHRLGALEQANRSTLFLDEAGDTPLALQSKLLRVLDGSPYRRVGDTADRWSDFRLVLSVRDPASQLVARGLWRHDFSYRVGCLTVELPRLVDRGDDVALLADHFMQQGGCVRGSSPDASVLLSHDWPGHVRELRRAVERAVFQAGGGRPDAAHIVAAARELALVPPGEEGDFDRRSLRAVIEEHIRRTMRACDGRVPEAARILGLSRSQLYRKLEALE